MPVVSSHRPALALALVVLLAGCAGAGGEPGDAAPSGGLLAFRDAREVIPGSLVRSANVRLPKSLGAKRVWVHSGGDAEMLLVNGEPVGRSARIRPGSRVAIAVRGPEPGAKAVGTVRVGATHLDLQRRWPAPPAGDQARLLRQPGQARPDRLFPGRSAGERGRRAQGGGCQGHDRDQGGPVQPPAPAGTGRALPPHRQGA
jgi:hypothetical protein